MIEDYVLPWGQSLNEMVYLKDIDIDHIDPYLTTLTGHIFETTLTHYGTMFDIRCIEC